MVKKNMKHHHRDINLIAFSSIEDSTSEGRNDGLSHECFAERNYEETDSVYKNEIGSKRYKQAWCGLKEISL
jgi:hypothetical protein